MASFWHLLFIGVWLYLQSSDIEKPQKPKGDRGGSTHYKLSIGNFKAETMRMCIEEIRRVESTPVPPGAKRPSRNEIAVSFGLSPSSVSSDIDLPYVFSGMQPLALPSVFPWLPLQKQ